VHCNAQDQLCQISKRGKVVVHGDVGQTFLYGAKGGDIYVLGNAAGRAHDQRRGQAQGRDQRHGARLPCPNRSWQATPLRAADLLLSTACASRMTARSFRWTCRIPGSNLPVAGSGRCDLRPRPESHACGRAAQRREFGRFTNEDWKLILPYLQETSVCSTYAVEREPTGRQPGVAKNPAQVYRKVMPKDHAAEAETEKWENS